MNKDFSGDVHADALAQPNSQRSETQRPDDIQRLESQRLDAQLVSHQTGLGHSSQVKKFKITIGGESYFLVSDEPEERVRAVARLVDGQMRAITQAGHSDDPKRVAVLVALQCASKMLANTELIEKCQAYNDKLLGLIAEEMTQFYSSSEQSS